MLAAWGSPISESSLCGVVLQEDDPSYSSAYVAGLEESNCLSTPVSMDRPNAENSNSSVICRSRTKGKYETVKNMKQKEGGRGMDRLKGLAVRAIIRREKFADSRAILTRELFIVLRRNHLSRINRAGFLEIPTITHAARTLYIC